MIPGRGSWLLGVVLRAGGTSQGSAWGIPWIWLAWERFMLRMNPLTSVRPGALFSFHTMRHRRRSLTLRDGSTVAVGAVVLELHLDNRQLARMRREPGFSTWRAVHHMRDDLAALASRVAAGELGPVSAIHGTSLIGRAGRTLGFDVQPLRDGCSARLERYFMAGIDAVYHPDGLARVAGRAGRRWPVDSWMSAARLADLYRIGTAANNGDGDHDQGRISP